MESLDTPTCLHSTFIQMDGLDVLAMNLLTPNFFFQSEKKFSGTSEGNIGLFLLKKDKTHNECKELDKAHEKISDNNINFC